MTNEKLVLQRFTVNNENLERLEAKLNEFNPFKILSIDEYEIRHSNFLAWLLTPNENHGLGDKFLKKVLSEIIIRNEDKLPDLSISWVNEHNFFDAEVRREFSNIDLLLISRSNKFVLLIENKINSKESKTQLKRYYDFVEKEFAGYKILPVYLTLFGDEPLGDERYCFFSYEILYKILKFNLELYHENISSKVYDFLSHYVKTLEGLTMEDKEIEKLCKSIYKDHKEAINLISQYSDTNDYSGAIDEFLSVNKDVRELVRKKNRFWFLPKEYLESIPSNSSVGWEIQYPIGFYFWLGGNNDKYFGLVIEIGPFTNPNKRVEFLNFLRDKKFFDLSPQAKMSKKAFVSPESKYSRVYSKYIKFENWDDSAELTKKMDDYYKEAQKVKQKMLEVIKEFKWK